MSLLLKLHGIPVNTYTNLFPFFMGTAFSSVLFFLFLSPKATTIHGHIKSVTRKTCQTIYLEFSLTREKNFQCPEQDQSNDQINRSNHSRPGTGQINWLGYNEDLPNWFDNLGKTFLVKGFLPSF